MTPADACAAALKLARAGYACFPCSSNKRPTCPHGFQQATTDLEDIFQLWVDHPGVLVGVATGPASQIAVLDIDAKHPEARSWYAQHRDRLLPTRVHRTRSGGLHLIFGDCDGLRCSVSKVTHGVDVRAAHGYIIWWPATNLPVLSDAPIAPWPIGLTPEPPPAPPRPRPFEPRGDIGATLNRALGLLRLMALCPEGERNRVLYWTAHRIRDMALDPASERQLFENLHAAALRAGLATPEIIRTLKSAARAA
jgi:hypothetical protein